MKLSRQLFTAFLTVAIVPLLIVSIYMFGTNIRLAFDLYKQNLYNSTEIQVNLLEEHINRMMVRAGHFAGSQSVREVLEADSHIDLAQNSELSHEILQFMDETLDSVAVFALVNLEGGILYSSGSNTDTELLIHELTKLEWEDRQYVFELPLEEQSGSLAIITPVKVGNELRGAFFVVYKTDYFLKMISTHKQMELSNALMYCNNHHKAMVSKLAISGSLEALEKGITDAEQGSMVGTIGDEKSLVYYRSITKTPWVLVNTISTKKIYALVLDYGLISVLILLVSVFVILFLSHGISKKIVKPLEKLLHVVEQFFITGAEKFPQLELNPKTEIGYLAGKFVGMSNEIAIVQSKLRESNYLYNTLLKATYELRIVIDLNNNQLESSSSYLTERLKQQEHGSAPEIVMDFLGESKELDQDDTLDKLRDTLFGLKSEPEEAEICCNMGEDREGCWYRLIVVPITDADFKVQRVVLHFEDITQKKLEEFRLIRSSQVDSLCGLLNKAAFMVHSQIAKKSTPSALFFIDLDQFKQVNDTLGHAVGDEVLIATAEIIQSQFRNTDILGRYGGDEFVIFAPHMTREQAISRASQLVQVLSFRMEAERGMELHVTASIGVCMMNGDLDLKQGIQRADEAMYHAKQNGKSQYYILP